MISTLVIFCYIGISQAIYSSVLLLTKRPIRIYDKIMIAWLLTIAVRFWLVAAGITHNPFLNISFSEALIPLTFGPFLYLYCKYLISEEKRFVVKDFAHFIPFIFLLLFGLLESILSVNIFGVYFDIALNLLYLLTTLIYSILVFIMMQNYRKSIRFNFFSYDSASNRLFWLNYIAVISVLSLSLYVLYMLLNSTGTDINYNLFLISTVTMVILVFSVSYFGVTQQSVTEKDKNYEHYGFRTMLSDIIDRTFSVNKIGRKISGEKKAENESNENKTDALTPQKIEQIELLKSIMQQEKPYLNQELTLQDLADAINIPKHQLTNLFNVHMGLNFFEFVNSYRLDEVKARLLDPEFENYTIIAIAFDCGFNSKSTFNTLFKEYTGLTPKQWRKENSENQTETA